MPPVVVLALHPCVADQAGLALLLTELNAALQSGTAAVALSDDAPNYGDWLSWLQEHADQQAAGPGLASLESPAMRAAALYALNDTPAGALQVAAQYHLPSSLSDMLCGQVTEQLAIAPLDLLAAALTSALSAQGDGNILMEAIDALRHPPTGATRSEEHTSEFQSLMRTY